jgi:hypothetical protein
MYSARAIHFPPAQSQVTLADFGGLRGVMALQDIAPGEAIITVPYELSLDLGSESADPTEPAVRTLQTRLSSLLLYQAKLLLF